MTKNKKNILTLSLLIPLVMTSMSGCIREGFHEQLYVQFSTGYYSTDVTISIDGELLYQNILTSDTSGYAGLFTTELEVGDYNISVTADTFRTVESFDLNAPLLLEVSYVDSIGLSFSYRELNVEAN